MVLLLTATKAEIEPLLTINSPFKVLTVGVGLTQAAINSTLYIEKYRPKLVVSFGICKGLEPTIEVGDILLAKKVSHYTLDLSSFKIPMGATFDKDGNIFNSVELNKIETDVKTFNKRRVHNNINFASADKFLLSSDTKVIDNLINDFNVSAVDMESYAIASSAKMLATKVSVARVVSDDYKGHKAKNFKKFLGESLVDLANLLESANLT